MTIDITNDFLDTGKKDISFADTDVYKAKNILDVQVGSLDFAASFGIDIAYYVLSELEFQAETFNAYLLGQLTKNGIQIKDYVPQVQNFIDKLKIVV